MYEGSAFPVQGWWIVELDGVEMALTFRMRSETGELEDVYTIRFTRENGWTPEL